MSRDNTSVALGKAGRTLFGASLAVTAAVSAVALTSVQFTRTARLIVAIVGLLPLAAYLLFLYVAERRWPDRTKPPAEVLASAAAVIFISAPVLFLTLRWVVPSDLLRGTVRAIVVTQLAYLVAFLSGKPLNREHYVFALWNAIRRVMIGVWSYDDATPVPEAEMQAWQRSRARFYVAPESLATFQETYSGMEFEAEALAAYVRKHDARQLSLLDIGCGEGWLSARLCAALTSAGCTVRQIVAIDPIPLAESYRRNLKSVGVDESRIVWKPSRFEDSVTDAKYELVVASHSLYGVIDNRRLNASASIERLTSFLAPGGVALVTLASRRGRAYRFKRDALRFLTGYDNQDLSAEDLDASIPLVQTSMRMVIDSVFDLTRINEDFSQGKMTGATQWLSYFLRVRLEDDDVIRELYRMLLEASLEGHELPESQIALFGTGHRPVIPESLVLPHKTVLFGWTLADAAQPAVNRAK